MQLFSSIIIGVIRYIQYMHGHTYVQFMPIYALANVTSLHVEGLQGTCKMQ